MSQDIHIDLDFVAALLKRLENAPERPIRKPSPELSYAGAYITEKGHIYRMETGANCRRYQSARTGEFYTMTAQLVRNGKGAHVTGYLNGELAYEQDWIIEVFGAMYYAVQGYMPNEAAAISGAFDCMMQKLPK